ncbi:hypothetical protein V6O07_21475 [Arthrospira platensis SPKY2]
MDLITFSVLVSAILSTALVGVSLYTLRLVDEKKKQRKINDTLQKVSNNSKALKFYATALQENLANVDQYTKIIAEATLGGSTIKEYLQYIQSIYRDLEVSAKAIVEIQDNYRKSLGQLSREISTSDVTLAISVVGSSSSKPSSNNSSSNTSSKPNNNNSSNASSSSNKSSTPSSMTTPEKREFIQKMQTQYSNEFKKFRSSDVTQAIYKAVNQNYNRDFVSASQDQENLKNKVLEELNNAPKAQ